MITATKNTRILKAQLQNPVLRRPILRCSRSTDRAFNRPFGPPSRVADVVRPIHVDNDHKHVETKQIARLVVLGTGGSETSQKPKSDSCQGSSLLSLAPGGSDERGSLGPLGVAVPAGGAARAAGRGRRPAAGRRVGRHHQHPRTERENKSCVLAPHMTRLSVCACENVRERHRQTEREDECVCVCVCV